MNIPDPFQVCDYTKPIHVPDAWLTWPGKEDGAPRPGIIWLDEVNAARTDVLKNA